MLCEDLAHATEQLNMLTEASKKHSGLLQSAQEELTKKDALIQELQHEVRCRGTITQDIRLGLESGQNPWCLVSGLNEARVLDVSLQKFSERHSDR